jgi:hypothetical protein
MPTSHIRQYSVYMLFINCRMRFKLLTDSLFIAICRSNWLHSRKYGIVWYHPASSRFYLTIFILCQFQWKLTGTLPDSNARATCVKLANPACCVLDVRCWFYINKNISSATVRVQLVLLAHQEIRTMDQQLCLQSDIIKHISSKIVW